MPGSSEGTAHPHAVSKDRPARRRGSWQLPVQDGAYAGIPAWTSRDGWVAQVAAALDTDDGRALCRAHRVSPASARAVAAAHAACADTATGRSVTAAVSTIAARAGVSSSVVSRTRRVLLALKLAHEVVCGRHLSVNERAEARAAHGGRQISAASVWALSTPEGASAQVKQRDSLPSPRRVRSLSSVRKKSPKPRTRGRKTPRPTTEPRTLHAQLAAAQLATRLLPSAPSLGHVDATGRITGPHDHIGAIADALIAAGVDTERWTGHAIADVIDAQNKSAGWTANRITFPARWLRHRLASLADTWTGPSPADRHRATQARIKAESDARAAERLSSRPASSTVRADAMAQIRAALSRPRRAQVLPA